LEKSGVGFGTPLYMAPEQFADAKHVVVRADIYSFGVMLFQMITGRLPFKVGSYFRLRSEAAPPPVESGHPALDMIVGKCLAKLAGGRYAGFGKLREELAGIYESMTKQAAPKPASGRELGALELINKGVSLGSLGRHEEGLACLDRALALNPKEALAWYNKGLALGRLGRYEVALACYDHALALNPQLAQAWYNKGVRLASLGRHEEALACYDRALAHNPQDPEAWCNKGLELWSLGRHEEALACCDRALALNPQFAETWNNKGNALASLGRYEEALACYDHALALNPQDAQSWYNNGVILAGEFSNFREAIACFEEAQRLGLHQAAQGIAACRKILRTAS
jgi:tetratricopeptide (TPR) repeat protein